ncbi:hypothetical protein FB566_4998 [Stackebrandtia endophytica]|uniref:Uncharacterized protein n=1 Tax=Stackebrandtia endophytica TaxID=1496996 RepID=A0A543B3J3_9ACTN|nr:hypothetical protein [Stackebrandtia endophytica]TQL79396.1 hypothetical protein FB566_4998 [Stackebrandtia endophytica]
MNPDFAADVTRLDGSTHTLAATRVASWEVMVGGGPERFIVTATGPRRVVNAITTDADRLDDGATVDLTVGGQAVDYPARYALTRSEVDVALADLAGATLPDSRWED